MPVGRAQRIWRSASPPQLRRIWRTSCPRIGGRWRRPPCARRGRRRRRTACTSRCGVCARRARRCCGARWRRSSLGTAAGVFGERKSSTQPSGDGSWGRLSSTPSGCGSKIPCGACLRAKTRRAGSFGSGGGPKYWHARSVRAFSTAARRAARRIAKKAARRATKRTARRMAKRAAWWTARRMAAVAKETTPTRNPRRRTS
mmetsp:Transcript_42480/g.99729  ORF Transcript_42480/g.99729 Transcript_42480/m.99729 type:complete len:201 (+) Transcript_42480:381-983(+)